MTNNQNLLTPEQRNLTPEEASIMGKLGGKASVEAKRKRKTYKQQLLAVIELGEEIAIKEARKSGNLEAIKMIEEGGLIAFEKLNIALSKKVKAETRLKALNDIVDRLEGKPSQTSNINHSGAVPTVIIDDIK